MDGISFTNRELDVMAVLWEAESATVAEVRDRLRDDLAYTTVLTVLRTLEEKGYVGHTQHGKAYRWWSANGLVRRPCVASWGRCSAVHPSFSSHSLYRTAASQKRISSA